jgi:hypothetical protein
MFSEDSIFKMMKKYFKEGKIHRVNEEHNSKRIVNDVIMIESFIVGDRVTSELYPYLTKVTWVASFHIMDEDYWNNVIMSDEFTGFSLEGAFIEKYEEDLIDETYSKVKDMMMSDISDDEIISEIKRMIGLK